MSIRVATDRSCWSADLPVAPMLRPLLGEHGVRNGATSWERRFDHYGEVAGSLFELTSVEDSDVVVLPGDWYWVRGTSWNSKPNRQLAESVRPLYERARVARKPVWLFFTGDRSCDRIPFEGVWVFREGAFQSRLGPRDRPLPAFPEDLVESHCGGSLVERPWRPRPTIGFCGLARPKPLIRRALGRAAFHVTVAGREHRLDPSPYLGEVLRAKAIALLDADPTIDTNFILRDSKVFFRDADTRDLVGVRTEYVDNLAESDYVLCVRGSGNYSYRLYEALCMGRVPVIVDTDLALPGGADIDWRALSVWVDRSALEQLPARIRDFHARLTPPEFAELQHRLRRLWTERLSPRGYFESVSDSCESLG